MSKSVSVIIPCLNEEKHIGNVIAAIANQTYPRSLIEVIIADGGSSDATISEIQKKQAEFTDLNIGIIENQKRIIPSALNRAIEASTGEIIVRMDAHSVPDQAYIEYCVQGLQQGMGANIGGLWLIQAGEDGWIARSIAHAAAHPFGVGDAKYRYSHEPAYVDTVPFGAFYRSLFEQIGYFDENLLTNEDYEFNMRIKQGGGKIYFDPRIKTKYYARAGISALARQYWRYGFWKYQMLRKYPETLRFRQALPPLFLLGLLLAFIGGIFLPWLLLLGAGIFLLYVIVLGIGTIPVYKKEPDLRLFFGVPLAIMTMHFSWGAGFIFSAITKNKGIIKTHGV